MKTERRHELQTNELADWLGRGVELAEQNGRAVIAVVVVVAVLIVAFLYIRSESANKRVKGWDRYFQALTARDAAEMQTVVETYPNTNVGAWARLAVADHQLGLGVNQLFVNRADANDQLRRAVGNFQEVANSSIAAKEPMIHQRALWGLARADESLNQLDKARAAYQQLADAGQWKNPLFATEAARRLKNLDRQSTKEFYDWFARQEPTPPPGSAAASPLNLENLPDEPPAGSPAVSPEATTPPAASNKAPGTEPASAVPPASESAPAQPQTSESAPGASSPAEANPAQQKPAENSTPSESKSEPSKTP